MPPAEAIEMPAKILPQHVQDRFLSANAGAQVGWSNSEEAAWPMDRAHELGKISDDEYSAACVYRGFYALTQPHGQSSFLRVVVDGGRAPEPESKATASQIIRAVHSKLEDRRYGIIAEHFCGQGHSARAACQKAGIGDPREIWATIRLALSKLSLAFERVRI